MKLLTTLLLALTFAVSLHAAQLTVTWDDNSTNETGFRVERALSPSIVFTDVGGTAANVTTFVDTSLTNNVGYSYRVRAYLTVGTRTIYSTYSNTAGATTDPSVNPPTNAKAFASDVLTLYINRGSQLHFTVVSR